MSPSEVDNNDMVEDSETSSDETNQRKNNDPKNSTVGIKSSGTPAVPVVAAATSGNNNPDILTPTSINAAKPAAAKKQATLTPFPLDWTKPACDGFGEDEDGLPIRYPSDVTEIPWDETEIVVVGTAGQKITNIGPDFSVPFTTHDTMKSIIFRSHLIKKLEGFDHFVNLDLLELYDNQVEALDNLNNRIKDRTMGQSLRVLDMSFNSIRDMQPVEFCPNLQELCKFK